MRSSDGNHQPTDALVPKQRGFAKDSDENGKAHCPSKWEPYQVNRCGEPLTLIIAIRKSMTKSTKSTKVKALDSQPLNRSDPVANVTNDETILNPNRRTNSDVRNRKNGLSKPSKMFKVASLNCRTLQTDASIVELNKLLHSQSIDITCIQEHRFVHEPTDPDIVARNLGSSTLFTASANRNNQGAAIHGVGIAINSKLLPVLLSV